MPRLDLRALVLGAALLAGWGTAPAVAEEASLHRFRAPIVVEQPAAFVRLPLTVEVYARSRHAELGDLRVLDASGERVPFALLLPRPDDVLNSDQWRDASLYRLPPRRRDGDALTSPVEVAVDGGRVVVKQGPATGPGQRSPGWLVDLGPRAKDQPAPHLLKLQWSGPAEFSSAYTLEHSADLRQWRRGGGGQLLALASSAGPLTQPDVPLPPDCQRFVRVVWVGAGPDPVLTAARAATGASRQVAVDPATEIVVAPSPEPAGKQPADAAPRALHFDLGAALPLGRLDLRLGSGTRVLPARVQARTSTDARWEPVTAAVFYRLEHGSELAQSPPLELRRSARYIRIVPDERAAAPKAEDLRLVVQARLASLIFAAQGAGRYELLAGADQTGNSAMPLATLVPDLERERPRLGRATLGPWTEVQAAIDQAQARAQRAALRPWLLWAVLLAGVAGLAWMVWRMARKQAQA